MANLLTFTTPIEIPAIKYATITRAADVNDTQKKLVLELQFFGDDNVADPNKHMLKITNGEIDTIVVNASPTTTQEILTMGVLKTEDEAEIANAFDIVMGQYVTAGLPGVLDKLQEWGALPAGVATSG
jgi:hypothetical protein